MRKFQREPGQDKADEGGHHCKMKDNVEGAESAIHVTCFIKPHIWGKKIPLALNSLFSQKSFLHQRKV